MYLLSSSAWFLKKVKGGLDPLFDKKTNITKVFAFLALIYGKLFMLFQG